MMRELWATLDTLTAPDFCGASNTSRNEVNGEARGAGRGARCEARRGARRACDDTKGDDTDDYPSHARRAKRGGGYMLWKFG